MNVREFCHFWHFNAQQRSLVKSANDRCKCLHIGQANAETNYLMNKTVILSTEREKDVESL